MKLLNEIYDEDVGEKKVETDYKTRKAVRSILKDGDKIAVLHVTEKNHHKLPGGGVEQGEDILQALKREILEETGCKVEIKDPIGKVIEHKSHQGKKQINTGYHAEVIQKGSPEFTQEEIENGFKLKWMTSEQTLKTLEEDSPNDYMGRFIVKRALTFLEEAVKQEGS